MDCQAARLNQSRNHMTTTLVRFLAEIIDTVHQLCLQKVHYIGESTGGIFGKTLSSKVSSPPTLTHHMLVLDVYGTRGLGNTRFWS